MSLKPLHFCLLLNPSLFLAYIFRHKLQLLIEMSLLAGSEDLSDEDVLYQAKLANQAELHSDCIHFLTVFIKRSSRDLASEEFNLLVEAYMNEVGRRRTALRSLRSPAQPERVQSLASMRSLIETEVLELCSHMLHLLDLLLNRVASAEKRVTYLKMKGLYASYVCETHLEVSKEFAEKGLLAYRDALSVARTELPPLHDLQIGVTLNLSIFYYEVMQDRETACALVQSTLGEAAQHQASLSRDGLFIMQLLRDNLTLWTQ